MISTPASKMTNHGKWMALIAAILGWMFDGFEMGLFPLTGRPALTDLLSPAADDPTWQAAPKITVDADGAALSAEALTAARKKEVIAEAAATSGKWFGVIMAMNMQKT